MRGAWIEMIIIWVDINHLAESLPLAGSVD